MLKRNWILAIMTIVFVSSYLGICMNFFYHPTEERTHLIPIKMQINENNCIRGCWLIYYKIETKNLEYFEKKTFCRVNTSLTENTLSFEGYDDQDNSVLTWKTQIDINPRYEFVTNIEYKQSHVIVTSRVLKKFEIANATIVFMVMFIISQMLYYIIESKVK